MKQRGDTIIEVLLAMAVLGLVIGTSYAIANRSLAVGRNAQEQTEAVKLAETQLEVLKARLDDESASINPQLTNGFRTTDRQFCVLPDGTVAVNTDPTNECDGVNDFYNIRLVYFPASVSGTVSPEHFESIVTWDRLNSRAGAEIRLVYRP